MITSVLVANRGEIARRIFRTARELGLSTVAVHSDVDVHHLDADLAVLLPGTTPAETYLRADLIVAAAKASGADAIHPGYGFLSENAAFARAVQDAGLTWIGPPPQAIDAMASKVEARKLAASLGIPILEGTDRYPLMVKASAGGGGRGMRIVRAPEDLDEALTLARAEAQNAFGDPAVFCEPYIEDAHHLEVQILADAHGTVWALGERECSVQRRHQKVIEETPSPLAERTPGLRDKLFEAAIAAARAVSYAGAGTVEFLVPADGSGFFFLEMNTRLQVEHPVTEAVTGLDLVALQLDIANGLPLPLQPPTPRGYAIEVRLYAEDASFTPQAGVLHRFDITGPVRVDSGYASGDTVSTHYDAMLAKVISHAATREAAAAKLAGALQRAVLHGPSTNRDLLVSVLRHPTFLAGDAHTAFLEHESFPPLADPGIAVLAAALSRPAGFRNVPSQPITHAYTLLSPTPFSPSPFPSTTPSLISPSPISPSAGSHTPGSPSPSSRTVIHIPRDVIQSGFDHVPGDVDQSANAAGAIADRDSNTRSADGDKAAEGANRHGSKEVADNRRAARRADPGRNPQSAGARRGIGELPETATRSVAVTFTLRRGVLAAEGFPEVELIAAATDEVVLAVHGVRQRFGVNTYGDAVFVDSPAGSVALLKVPRFADPALAQAPGTLNAPMPGTITEVLVAEGGKVQSGQPLLRLEAMKMQHTVHAPTGGTVSQLSVQPGQQVDSGAPLAVITEEEHP